MNVRQLMARPAGIEARRQLRRDIAGMLVLNRQYSGRTGPEQIKELIRSGACICLIADENGVVVGFLLMAVADGGAAILDVETDTDHLGSGVTSLLIEKAQEVARSKGASRFCKIGV